MPWLAIGLLLLMLLALAWSLMAARWAQGLHVIQWAVVGGVLTGALLATTSWPRWFVRLYGAVTGLAWTLYLGSTLISDRYVGAQRAIEVIARLVAWGNAALSGEPSGDNLVFVVDVSFLLWWVSVFSTLALAREYKVWPAILPGALTLVINAYYAPRDLTPFLILYAVSALLLLAAIHLEKRVMVWDRARVRYPMDIALDFLRDGLLFALAAITIAWGMPTAADSERVDRLLRPLKAPWHRVQEEWGRMFNALNYRSGLAIPVFGRSFSLRGAPNLTDIVLFTVEAPQGRYWRSAVYDYYRSRGWDSTTTTTVYLGANEPVPFVPPRRVGLAYGRLVAQTVTVHLPGALSLIAAPSPLYFSVPVEAEVALSPRALIDTGPALQSDPGAREDTPPAGNGQEATELPGRSAMERTGREILFAYARTELDVGDSYTVVSLVTDPDAPSLRAAGTRYPQWVVEYYLQLPETLPERVRALAREITASYDNAYDKAKAIERYLRAIPYNEQIPFPPAGQDAVDWFLFELQEGYCDYYASAFAVMARAVGIPTRLASGFARGLYDKDASTWTVREEDAHTWPEVWFPGYGWVEFEPTPSEPPLDRRENTWDLGPGQDEMSLLEELRDERQDLLEELDMGGQVRGPLPDMPLYGVVAGVPWYPLMALTVIGLIVYQGWHIARRRLLSRPDLPATLYERLVHWARRLGIHLTATQTPVEHATIIGQHLPQQQGKVQRIVEAYQVTTYAPPARREEILTQREQLLRLWERLQPVFWRAWVRVQWKALVRLLGRFR